MTDQRMFTWSLILIGIASLGIGVMLGIIISQVTTECLDNQATVEVQK